MDVKYINPFIDSFMQIFPQFGMNDIKKGRISLKGKEIKSTGVMIMLGLIGDVRGNVIYSLSEENAMKIASIMMCGAPVNSLDELAQSAISELTNMLTATAATAFYNNGISIDISIPTLMYGEFSATSSTDKTICVEMIVQEMPFEINIAFEKIME
jgi:chemotaxis protein CheX